MADTIVIIIGSEDKAVAPNDAAPWARFEESGTPIGDPKGTFRLADEVVGLDDSGAWAHWVEECNDCDAEVDCYRLQAEQAWVQDSSVPGGFDPVFLAVCKPCLETRLAYFYLNRPKPGSYEELAEYEALWTNCSRCRDLCPVDEVELRRGSSEVLCSRHT